MEGTVLSLSICRSTLVNVPLDYMQPFPVEASPAHMQSTCPNALCTTSRDVEETAALVEGVERCGEGKWAEIKKLSFPSIAARSAVDLKDKWRNLMRVALAPKSHLRCLWPPAVLAQWYQSCP